MSAFSFSGNQCEFVFLEQFHSAAAAVKQEVILADADPEQLQPLFQISVVEFGLMLFEPGFAGGSDLSRGVRGRRAARSRSLTREDVEQPGTEDAYVAELFQVRQRDVERLI